MHCTAPWLLQTFNLCLHVCMRRQRDELALPEVSSHAAGDVASVGSLDAQHGGALAQKGAARQEGARDRLDARGGCQLA